MDYKISDYSLACKSLQILCKRLDCDFFDLPVVFEKECKQVGYKDGSICLDSDATLIDTMSNIYSIYVNNLSKICGRNIDNLDFRRAVTNYFMAMLRDFAIQYKNKRVRDPNEHIVMYIDQFPLVWMLLKNIICPYKNIQLKNLKVVAKNSAEYDCVRIFNVKEENVLFVNLDIEKNSIRSAFLLVESLRLMVDDDNEPEAILRDMFTNYFMKERILDFLGIVLNDDTEIANFIAVLSVLCQSPEMEAFALKLKSNVKVAQASAYVGNWWFMGLTEKMMESVRGPDYSTTVSLKDFSKELWEKVEKERKARGLTELPFEMLLRLQSEDKKTPPDQVLQKLLSKVRIW
jgi:hypothetical protein